MTQVSGVAPAAAMPIADSAIIRLTGVEKVYRTGKLSYRALRGVDLAIEPGEMVAIVGPSGSGKTTILNLASGIDRPTAGSISVTGRRIDTLDEEQLATWRGLNPPEGAVALCVDEKSQLQALARSQPAFPMMPGMPERRTHDYVRHGVTSLFAAFNTADGTVISSLHRQHRTIEFKKFLAKIDSQVPDHLDVHLVCDNYGTHKSPAVKKWLAAHPRFQMHHTPTYSSWINQVERWFAYLTDDLLRRGDHRSVQAVEADIRSWVKAWNDNPKPFIWTKTAEQILDSLGRLIQRINGAGH